MSRADLDELRQDIQEFRTAEWEDADLNGFAANVSGVLLTVLNVLENLADENDDLTRRVAKLERT